MYFNLKMEYALPELLSRNDVLRILNEVSLIIKTNNINYCYSIYNQINLLASVAGKQHGCINP